MVAVFQYFDYIHIHPLPLACGRGPCPCCCGAGFSVGWSRISLPVILRKTSSSVDSLLLVMENISPPSSLMASIILLRASSPVALI